MMPQTTSTAIPCLRYRDAPAAIDWLCRVLGFERHLVVPDDAGGIAVRNLCWTAAASAASTGKVICGASAPTTHGRHDAVI